MTTIYPLRELLTVLRNGTTVQQNTNGDGLPVTRIETIRDGEIDLLRVRHVDMPLAKMEKWRLLPGDILFSHINSVDHIGKTAMYKGSPEVLLHGMNLMLLRPNQDLVEPEYLLWYLRSAPVLAHFRARCKQAVNQASLNQTDIGSLPVPLVRRDEQRHVVDLLNRAEGIRRLAEEAQAKARDLIPALFVDMFGDPATNPKGWPLSPLDELVRFQSGGTPSRAQRVYWGGDIPWVSAKDMKPPLIDRSKEKLTAAALEHGKAKLVPEGSVLIVVRGMILAHTIPIRITTVPVVINQDLKALIPSDLITSCYLRWALQSYHSHLLKRVSNAAHGTAKLDMSVLQNLLLPVPPQVLQEKFSNRVREIEGVVSLAHEAGEFATMLMQSLMSELFSPAQSARIATEKSEKRLRLDAL